MACWLVRRVVCAGALGVAGAACASSDPYARNVVAPEGSIYAEPAAQVRNLGYEVAHVDTIIGFIEAYRLRGGLGGEADRLVVDVFTAVPSGRRVVSVVGQTLGRVQLGPFGRIGGRLASPSRRVEQDAQELLRQLGCARVSAERRMTVDGLEIEAWCARDRASPGSAGVRSR